MMPDAQENKGAGATVAVPVPINLQRLLDHLP